MEPIWELFWTDVYRLLEIAPTDVEVGIQLIHLLMATFGATYHIYFQGEK
jgi:hypothetical protein